MASLLYIPQYKQTVLNVPGGITDAQTTGIIVSNTDGVDITKPGLICVTYADPLDTTVAEFITFTSIDSNKELQGVTRAGEGIAAKAHLNNAQVAFIVSKSHINLINDKLTGVDTTVVTDTAGNELLKVAQVASAVNYLQLRNSATGNAPALMALGDNTDIDLDLIPKGAGDVNIPTSANIQVNNVDPWRTILLNAGVLKPTTTAGCADSAKVEAGTNKIDYDVLDFDTTTAENAYVNLQMPDSYDGGVIQFRYVWTNAAGLTTETVKFTLKGRALDNDGAIDQANGTAVGVSDTWIAQGDIHISDWSGDVTLAGSPAGGQWVHLEVTRDVANDNMTGDARLIAVQIRFKQKQYSD